MVRLNVHRVLTRQCWGAGRRKLELSLACYTLAATSAEFVFQGCVVQWIQGNNEHVANDLRELFPQLENQGLRFDRAKVFTCVLTDPSCAVPALSSQKEEYAESGPAVSAEVLQGFPSYAHAQCCMVHITHILKVLSGLLPALSIRGGFRREGTTNRDPSLFGPQSCMEHVDFRHTCVFPFC